MIRKSDVRVWAFWGGLLGLLTTLGRLEPSTVTESALTRLNLSLKLAALQLSQRSWPTSITEFGIGRFAEVTTMRVVRLICAVLCFGLGVAFAIGAADAFDFGNVAVD